MDRRSLLSAALAAAAPAMLPGLARGQAARSRTLRVVPETLTTIFDPHFTTSFTTRDFGYLVYDTLVAVNDRWEPTPQMAERWETSADGLEWRFILRDGLVFHDGEPVTAEDCAASLRRWGRRDALGGVMFRAVDALDAPDPRTLRIRLKRPFGLVLQALGKPGAMVPMILPRRLAELPPERPITEPTGSGPYRFVAAEYRPGDRIVLARHEGYRPRAEPAIWASGGKRATFDRIELLSMPDVSTQVGALATGAVDYVERLPADVLPVLDRNRAVRVQVVSPFGYQALLRFNHLLPPFDDVRARRAVMLAVDQNDYLPGVAGRPDYGRECRSMLGCGTPYETMDGIPPAPDLEGAKRLLREAGTDLTRPVIILHPADAPGIAALGLVTQDLLTRLGFTVDLQATDLNTFFARRTKPEGWNVFHTTNTVPDMQTPLQNAYLDGTGPPAGFAGWPRDEAVQAARQDFAAATDEAGRRRAAAEVHRRAAEDGFYMPLGQFVAASAWRADLADVPVGPAMFLWNIRRG